MTVQGRIGLTAAVSVFALTLTPPPMAWAQTPGDDDPAVLDTVVTTAQKRETRLLDTPISITALDGDELLKNNVVDMRDIQFLAPGVHVGEFFGKSLITIRGIGNDTSSISADPGVAVHQDGFYLARRLYQSGAFYDVERIEVMRGPQGTIYGRNATGGNINVITKSPTPEFEANGRITVGNYDLIATEGAISGPVLGESVMGRIAFKTNDHDGYTPNLFNNERYDDSDESNVRAKLLFAPTGNLNIELAADSRKVGGFGAITPVQRFDPNVPTPQEAAGGIIATGRAVNHDHRKNWDADIWGISGRVTYDFGEISLVSITAYREMDTTLAYDIDGTDLDGAAFDPAEDNQTQFTQELNLVSDGSGAFNWVIGAFYFEEKADSLVEVPFPLMPAAAAGLTGSIDTTSYAVFADATYDLTDRLQLTTGFRWGEDEKDLTENYFVGDTNGFLALAAKLNDTWSSFTPRAALTYFLNDNSSVYFTYSEGFKSGGFNMFGFQGVGYDPEEVKNYELGWKTTVFNNRVSANTSIFQMDYTDLQVFQIQDFFPLITNAAEARIRGLEFDGAALLTDTLKIDGNLTYLDAEFEEYIAPDPARGGAEFDLSGNRMMATPEWSVNIGAEYTAEIGSWGTITSRGEYAYKSEVFFRPFNLEQSRQDAYSTYNARVTFEPLDGNWNFSIWGKNLTDELVAGKIQIGGAVLGSPIETQYLPPRTFGVAVGYNF